MSRAPELLPPPIDVVQRSEIIRALLCILPQVVHDEAAVAQIGCLVLRLRRGPRPRGAA